MSEKRGTDAAGLRCDRIVSLRFDPLFPLSFRPVPAIRLMGLFDEIELDLFQMRRDFVIPNQQQSHDGSVLGFGMNIDLVWKPVRKRLGSNQ